MSEGVIGRASVTDTQRVMQKAKERRQRKIEGVNSTKTAAALTSQPSTW